MVRESQRGSALVETAVAVAIACLVAGALLNATILATHSAGIRPARETLEAEVRRELPIAVDILKYQGGAVVPAAIATTLPMATGTPLPVNVSIAVAAQPGSSIRVTIAAVGGNPPQRATLNATVGGQAPVPGSVVTAPGLAPAPTGAP